MRKLRHMNKVNYVCRTSLLTTEKIMLLHAVEMEKLSSTKIKVKGEAPYSSAPCQ